MIYTSYFGAIEQLPKDYALISIARSAPKYWFGLEYKKLAPSLAILSDYKRTGNEEKYIQEFSFQLFCLTPSIVIDELVTMARGYNIILMCYEKPQDFCHRHLVAKWLTDNGYKTQEFNYGN